MVDTELSICSSCCSIYSKKDKMEFCCGDLLPIDLKNLAKEYPHHYAAAITPEVKELLIGTKL